jgi:integrase
MYDVMKLISHINNYGYKTKINYRVENNKIILFLNYRTNIKGVTKNFTKRITALHGIDKKMDIKKIKFAYKYREKFEQTFDPDEWEKSKTDMLLTTLIDNHAKEHTNQNTFNLYQSMKKRLLDFATPNIKISQVDKVFCMNFVKYLQEQGLKGAASYWTLFKCVLNKAIDLEIIQEMPFLRKIYCKPNPTTREYLTQQELTNFANLETPHKHIQDAFIFSCYTGLRISDLKNIKFTVIQKIDTNNETDTYSLTIQQQKTKAYIQIPLHQVALDIINKQDRNKELIFNLPSVMQWNLHIRNLCKKAGINKHITGHCARHTFATLCITKGVDIFTTSKLLGHSNVSTTQIYAKLVDQKRVDGINMLPSL